MDRELQAEAQVRAVAERSELPLLAVQLDGRHPQVGFHQDKAGDVERELRLHIDAAERVDLESLRRHPIDRDGGIERSHESELSTDLEAGLRAHDGNANTEP